MELLFQVKLFHPYYASGVFEDCQLIADAGTEYVIARYQLLTRRTQGAFGLYTSSQGGAAGFVKYLLDYSGNAPLRFWLACNSEKFVFITDLPLDWVGLMELSSQSGVARADGNEINITLTPTMSPKMTGKEGLIGEISIYPSDLLSLFATGAKSIGYVAHFQVRALHWIYYVINRSQTRLNDPAVCDRAGVYFDGPIATTLPGGEKALEFNSGKMQFALQQVPAVIFDLVDRTMPSLQSDGQAVENCLMTGLPAPKGDQLGARQGGENPYVFGAMYVYL